MKKKAIMALMLICALMFTMVSGPLTMTVNASESDDAGNNGEIGGTVSDGDNQKVSGLEEIVLEAPEPEEEFRPEAPEAEEDFEPQVIYVPEEVPYENDQKALFQICTQVFEESGIQISILSEEDIVLKDAVIRIIPVESIESESIEEAVQWMAEAELEEKTRKADGVSLSIYNMYADLEVSGSSSYAFQLEISYKDEQGNECVLRPEENNNLQIVIEALNSEEVPGEELQSVEFFSLTQGGGAVFSSEPGEDSPSIYTISIVKYAAKADAAMVAAEQRAWNIINTYADLEYFLSDPYKSDMTEAQYEELHQAALTATAGCSTQYDKIKAITGFVADRIYYDYYYLMDKENHPTYFNPYEVYTQKRTVCAGYARLVRTLCISLGIPCMDIIGDNHEYNAIYDRDQNKWIFADATWCSRNKYTAEQQWVYGGSHYLRFDLKPEEIALLTSHEVYGVDGLLDGTINSVYYSLTAPRENWAQTDNWYLAVSGARQVKAKAVGSFAGLSVTNVKPWSFNEDTFLVEMNLTDTKLTNIGYAAFYKCSSLEKISFPDSLTEIEEWAFGACEKLAQADLSHIEIADIGNYAFYRCASLREVDLFRAKLERIGDYAFCSCSSLEKVSYPGTLVEVGNRAFGWCKVLSEIDLMKTKVKSIGDYAFYDCEAANIIKLPSTLTQIGASAFAYAKTPVTTVITPLSAEAVHYPGGNNEWQYRKNVTVYTYYGAYDGYEFYAAENGGTVCLDSTGRQVINEFKCDGIYTYYFQADGTAMRDRLSYHPDGVHVIYFDQNGHEVFDNFAYVGHNIPSMQTGIATELNEYCYFNTFGYQYTDVVTYDVTGKELYYANTSGVLERGRWFTFSDTVKYAGDNSPWSAAGQRGYANENCTLLKDTYTYDEQGNLCYMQGNGAATY